MNIRQWMCGPPTLGDDTRAGQGRRRARPLQRATDRAATGLAETVGDLVVTVRFPGGIGALRDTS